MSAYQIRLSPKGKWHRRQHGNGNDHTACGKPIEGAWLSRDWVLDDQLCHICFTDRERDTGEMRKLEQEQLERAKVDGWDDPHQITPTDVVPVKKR